MGIFFLVLPGWVFSTNRKRSNWKLVAWGISLQPAFAVLVAKIVGERTAATEVVGFRDVALIPAKTKTLSQIGICALCAVTLACMMTARTAGIFFTDTTILLEK
ncbi:MAG: hypothetical protein JW913_05715 [Chitinispirillaceae bacterium]|nr:hypothetical protein [Chitinispirillaceae bacterium]